MKTVFLLEKTLPSTISLFLVLFVVCIFITHVYILGTYNWKLRYLLVRSKLKRIKTAGKSGTTEIWQIWTFLSEVRICMEKTSENQFPKKKIYMGHSATVRSRSLAVRSQIFFIIFLYKSICRETHIQFFLYFFLLFVFKISLFQKKNHQHSLNLKKFTYILQNISKFLSHIRRWRFQNCTS